MADVTKTYLKCLSKKFYYQIFGMVLARVMDNLSVHKVKEIKNILELAGIKVIYLSPYSPEFNPIENCWSKIKAYLRNLAARSRDELEKGLVEALDRVTKTDIRNWFAHCCYCTS